MKNTYKTKVLKFLSPSELEQKINETLEEFQDNWWNIKNIQIEKNDKVENSFIVIIIFYKLG